MWRAMTVARAPHDAAKEIVPIQFSNSNKRDFAISRRDAPELCQKFPRPSKQRAQGTPGARCTRGLVRKLCKRKRTRAYRFSGGNPAFPAQWF
jgi:hypothetical protein